jgi:hypothetical protein
VPAGLYTERYEIFFWVGEAKMSSIGACGAACTAFGEFFCGLRSER